MRPQLALGVAAACALLSPTWASAQEITVVGLDGRAATLDASALSALPRGKADLVNKGTVKTYEGPLLTYVLRAVGAPAGARLHGPVMKTYVVVTGADGFSAVLSLAETDKDFHEGAVVLADRAGGAKLEGKEGPYRLVIAGDRKASRSVYGAVKVELKTAE